MVRTVCVALLSLLLAVCAFGQAPNWSAGVVYEYDGSGNVRKIGTDTYVYDTAQRLVRGSVGGSQQSYTYDSFGNRKTCQPAGGGDCQYGFTVDSTTNRVEGRLYDKRGNMLQLPEGNTLEYDELGMVRKENGAGRAVYYIYTADDERIAVYDADTQLGSHKWEWTVRGLDRKPLREFTSQGSSGTGSFKWVKDHVWRDSVLLASRQAEAGAPGGVSTYHYHVDHLGTPRQVTSSASVIVGRHDYLPFGPELSSTRTDEPRLQDLKFTGHERDEVRDRPPLDYMHARYYEPRLGRFLSVDPTWASADIAQPQSWNRYSYALNNPVRYADPDGRCSPAVIDCVLEGGSAGGVPGAVIGLAIGVGIFIGGEVDVDGKPIKVHVGEFMLRGSGSSGEMAAERLAQNMSNHMAEQQQVGAKQTTDPKRRFSKEDRKAGLDKSKDAEGIPRCEYCGDELNANAGNGNSYEADHREPHAQGGRSTQDNLAPACRTCNRGKGNRTPEQWKKDKELQ